LIGLGLSLGGLLSIGWYIYNKAQQSQQALIQLRYGALLMDVHERVIEPLAPAIDVRKIDDLAKIAERQNTMILHMSLNLMDYYLVQGNGMTYRYVVGNNRREAIAVQEPVHNEILHYMLDDHAKTIIDVEPPSEVILRETFDPNRNKIQKTESPEKVMFRYSMNVTKTSPKAEASRKETK